jgi:hypothetical protein
MCLAAVSAILRSGIDSLLCAGLVTSQGYQKYCGDDRRSKNHNFCDVRKIEFFLRKQCSCSFISSE